MNEDANFRGQSGLCEVQCSKIAAPAKVKEIVSNQLSLVIEPDYSQQKMPGYQNQDQNQNQKKSKPKSNFDYQNRIFDLQKIITIC
jgi:hypothetical protein